MTTGITMNLTTLAAVTIALVVTQSEVIRQIMLILFIGLLVEKKKNHVLNLIRVLPGMFRPRTNKILYQ